MTTYTISHPKELTTDTRPSLGECALAYLQTTDGLKKLVLELFSSLADWFTLARPSDTVSTLSTNVKQVRLLSAFSKVPEEIVKTAHQAHTVYQEKNLGSLAQLFNRVCAFLVQATDVVDVVNQRVYPLSQRCVKAIGIVGNGALAITGMFDLEENIRKVQEAANSALAHSNQHSTRAIINGVGAFADIATGLLSIANLTALVAVPAWVIMAFTTQSLLATIGSRFYCHLNRIS